MVLSAPRRRMQCRHLPRVLPTAGTTLRRGAANSTRGACAPPETRVQNSGWSRKPIDLTRRAISWTGPNIPAEACEEGVKQDAYPHRASAPHAVAEIAQSDACDGCAKHQRRREPREPVTAKCGCVRAAQEALRYGQRGDRHQPRLDAVEDKADECGCQHGDAGGRGERSVRGMSRQSAHKSGWFRASFGSFPSCAWRPSAAANSSSGT